MLRLETSERGVVLLAVRIPFKPFQLAEALLDVHDVPVYCVHLLLELEFRRIVWVPGCQCVDGSLLVDCGSLQLCILPTTPLRVRVDLCLDVRHVLVGCL
jgi:hypothetical protein